MFGNLRQNSGKTSDYLNAVNAIYTIVRQRLSDMAYQGRLTARQTISAKKIIHNLNKESVDGMVQLLRLNGTAMSPEDLVKLIKTMRTDGSLPDEIELKIKEVVYFKKLYAIRALVLLLDLKKMEVELPDYSPNDLIDIIFTPGLDFLQSPPRETPLMDLETSDRSFFSCFHRAYTQWKQQNGL